MSPARSALPGFAIAIAVLIAGLLLALTVGRYPISLGDLIGVLLAKAGGSRRSKPVSSTVRCSFRRWI